MNSSINVIIGCVMAAILFNGCLVKSEFTLKIIDDASPNSTWMKTIGDINNDSRVDLVVGGWRGGGLVAYLAPDWNKILINDSLRISTDAEICDIDNNGTQDIVAIVHKTLIWFEGPKWNFHVIDSVVLHDVEIGDLDNNGMIDVVGRNQSEFGQSGDSLYIYSQWTEGAWKRYIIPIINGEGLKLADINNDGQEDIVLNGYWLENTGIIQDWKHHQFTDTWTWRSTFIDVADMNDDGSVDILMSPAELAKNYYHLSWFESPENITTIWKEHIVVDSIESAIHFIGASDFNKDGKMDFMIAHMEQAKNPDEVSIYYQKNKNKWRKQVISTEGSHSMRLFDFDDDGDIDAFGANHADHVVKMWINQME